MLGDELLELVETVRVRKSDEGVLERNEELVDSAERSCRLAEDDVSRLSGSGRAKGLDLFGVDDGPEVVRARRCSLAVDGVERCWGVGVGRCDGAERLVGRG